jgi:glycosyltransferase involved in cell wall biosynthesis
VQILFLTTLLPGAGYTGSEVATQAFANGLRALGHDVKLLAYRRAGDDPPLHADDRPVADRKIETRSAGIDAPLWMARALLTRRPYSFAKYVSSAYREAIADELRSAPPDLVVLDHAQVGWATPDGGWPVPYVYIAHNVEYRVHEELAAAGGPARWAHAREAKLIRREESALCRDASAVWTLTSGEAEAAGSMGAGDRTRAFDLPGVADPDPPPAHATCDVATLGSWTWKSNAEGLLWFLREVRPLLPDDLRIHIGGAASQELSAKTPNVTARGRVPDAMEFLQSARVVAAPSVAGAGVQIKTLDAIASGRRVVATQTAMRGIEDPPPTVRVASDAAGFAEAIGASLEEGQDEDASRQGQAWARERRARFLEQLRAGVGQFEGAAA